MDGSSTGPAAAGMERTARLRSGAWEHLGGILAIAAAAALWAAIAWAVAAPLGDALARIESREPPPACAAPRDAVASAAVHAARACP